MRYKNINMNMPIELNGDVDNLNNKIFDLFEKLDVREDIGAYSLLCCSVAVISMMSDAKEIQAMFDIAAKIAIKQSQSKNSGMH